FRKGQAPDEVAKKSISQAEIFTEALKNELDTLVKVAAKEIKEDLMVLDSPAYDVQKITATELTVTFIYPVYPEVKLPDYKTLGIKYEVEKATEESVKEELERALESQVMLKEKEGSLSKGDIAVFDFEGFIEGKPFAGGKAENYELEIGSGQFIAGFEDQMVGLEKGKSMDVKVSFPEDYHVEELKAKPSVFKIKLNSIKTKQKPELNDE
uniref:peptidylprolyl isomerase n=1 Tax=Biomphalaria glabrata TaxID=6526 RepID=A0A2C9KSY7_BIOGL